MMPTSHPSQANRVQALLDPKLRPKAFRIFFLGLAIAGLLFVALTYLVSVRIVQESLLEGKAQQMQSNLVLLQEQLTSSLGMINAKLRPLADFNRDEALRAGRLSSTSLAKLIENDRLIRTLVLVDERGQIVSSSQLDQVGLRIPAQLASPGSTARIGTLNIGAVYPVNDLTQLAAGPSANSSTTTNPPNPSSSLWLVSMTVPVEKRLYELIAVINTSVFKNLWNQADVDDLVEIALLNQRGELLLSHQNGALDLNSLSKALMEAMREGNQGSFEFGNHRQYFTVFKENPTDGLILAMTIDKESIFSTTDPMRNTLRWVAIFLSIGIIALTAIRFLWYQRYENSLIRLKNQSAAISAHLLITESDLQGNIRYANQGFLEATGYSPDEIIGKNYRILDSGLHSQTFFAGLWATLQSGKVWHGTLRNKKKSGEFFWVDVTIVPFTDVWGKVASYLTLYTNITESIAISEKYNQERLLREELARVNRDLFNDVNTDSLTGVSNRRALTSFMDKSISTARQFGMPVSFLMLDLDHFKYINDNYGHSVGDLVLQEITQRWKKQIRSSDMLARIGGEEFCIVLPQAGLQQAKSIAEKIRLATSQAAIHVRNHQAHDLNLNISVSIGLASSENRTEYDATMLMECADEALYQAKSAGRNQVITST